MIFLVALCLTLATSGNTEPALKINNSDLVGCDESYQLCERIKDFEVAPLSTPGTDPWIKDCVSSLQIQFQQYNQDGTKMHPDLSNMYIWRNGQLNPVPEPELDCRRTKIFRVSKEASIFRFYSQIKLVKNDEIHKEIAKFLWNHDFIHYILHLFLLYNEISGSYEVNLNILVRKR